MVRKVVIPATISVRTVVLFSLSLNSCSSIRGLPRRLSQCAGIDLCKTSENGLRLPLGGLFPTVRRHADEPIFPAYAERKPGRGADRFTSPDAARGADSTDQRRDLCLVAAGLSRAEEHRTHRARG